MKLLPLALSLFALLLAAPATAADIRVVASFSILGDMVRAVGGDRVETTTIVGPDADTHIYEPKPSDAAALSKADLVVVNGLGFEGWIDRLKGASGYAGAWIVASDGVATHAMAEESHDDAEQGGDVHGHGPGELDPHAWQSLRNGAIYVENIRKGLCSVDATGCDIYSANAKAYVDSIMALDADVRARIDAVPIAQRKVITSHDAFGYFAQGYGVAFLSPEGMSTDAEPSAAGVARLIIQIKSEGVKALFLENMSDPRLISQIAKETGIQPGGTLYADALSPPDGPAATYLDMFAHNAALLIAAMSGT